jgi:predicted outer membrane lipoprotein
MAGKWSLGLILALALLVLTGTALAFEHPGSRSYRRSGFSGLSHFSSRTAAAARTPLGSVDGQGTGSPDPLTLTQPDSSRHQINAQPQAGCQLRAC